MHLKRCNVDNLFTLHIIKLSAGTSSIKCHNNNQYTLNCYVFGMQLDEQ